MKRALIIATLNFVITLLTGLVIQYVTCDNLAIDFILSISIGVFIGSFIGWTFINISKE